MRRDQRTGKFARRERELASTKPTSPSSSALAAANADDHKRSGNAEGYALTHPLACPVPLKRERLLQTL